MSAKVRVTPITHRAKWAQQPTQYDVMDWHTGRVPSRNDASIVVLVKPQHAMSGTLRAVSFTFAGNQRRGRR